MKLYFFEIAPEGDFFLIRYLGGFVETPGNNLFLLDAVMSHILTPPPTRNLTSREAFTATSNDKDQRVADLLPL